MQNTITAIPAPRISHLVYDTLVQALTSAPKQQNFATIWKGANRVQTVTFGEFMAWSSAQARLMHQNGVHAGDRVILIMEQGIPLMSAFAGAMLLGAVPAILAYPNSKVEPNKYFYGLRGVSNNLNAKLIVIDSEFPTELICHIGKSDESRVIIAVEHLDDAASNVGLSSIGLTDVDPESIAFIQHSAGTTGLQKGVALSHCSVLRQLHHLCDALNISGQDRIYSWLPLYHDMGLIACFLLPLVAHLPVVMQSPTGWVMRPETMLYLIDEYRCTLCWVPNFTLQLLARRVPNPQRRKYSLSSLRAIINCSEPVRAQSMDEFTEAYAQCGLRPNVLQSCYAMAETVFAVTQSGTNGKLAPVRVWVHGDRMRQDHVASRVNPHDPNAICFVSSGQCITGSTVRIVGPEGILLGDGHVGELQVRSDSLFFGYYNRHDLTEAVLQDSWYTSGDLGFQLDSEVYVTGRKNDLIIVGGRNIYPQDVEEILFSHLSIHDGRAVAFGMYNPDLGTEEVIAVAEVNDVTDLDNSREIERAARKAVFAELGIVVKQIYLKPPKWIIKSTAGKNARSATREKLLREHPELSQEAAPSCQHQ